MRRAFGFLVGASCALPLWMSQANEVAFAQETPAATDEVNDAIVVTARRREESLQDTPVAITALSAEALERQQLVGTADLDKVTPNLQFTSYATLTGNNSASQVFIRGIGQTDATPSVDPGVGLYIDDVYMGRAVGGVMDFRDIERVQVLRGPQGTLFGRNTIGGAVLLTTKGPGAGDTLRVALGEDDLHEVFVAKDFLISDELGARASFGFRERDGYVTRAYDGLDLGNENTYSGQASLHWTPTEDLTFVLRGDFANADEHGSPFVSRAMNENAAFAAAQSVAAGCPGATFPPPFVPSIPDPRCANDFQALGPFTSAGTYPVFSTLENYGGSLTAELEVNDVLSFKSITARRRIDWTGARDADNTPLPIIHTNYSSRSEQFSQEVQALIDTDRLTGVVGAYYFDEESADRIIVPVGNPGTSYDTQRVNLDAAAWAVFTEWTYDITDALSLSAGIRYTDETKGIQGVLFNVAPASAPEPPFPTTLCPPGGPPPTQTGCLFITGDHFETNFTSTIGSASVQYRWSPAVMTYLSWSQGFKSGGFNQRYNQAPPGNAPLPFRAETAETFELGFKSNPADGLRLNGALFHTSYDDMQLTYRLGVVNLLFNAGAATLKGGELELVWSPMADLEIDASLGYLDNHYDEINALAPIGGATPTAVATIDKKLPFTPEWQWHVGASYAFHLSDAWMLTPRVDISYTDSQFFDAVNTPEIAQLDAVTVVNGTLALEDAEGKWRLALRGDNLTDELYPLAGTSSLTTATGYAEIIYARPRSFSVTATLNY